MSFGYDIFVSTKCTFPSKDNFELNLTSPKKLELSRRILGMKDNNQPQTAYFSAYSEYEATLFIYFEVTKFRKIKLKYKKKKTSKSFSTELLTLQKSFFGDLPPKQLIEEMKSFEKEHNEKKRQKSNFVLKNRKEAKYSSDLKLQQKFSFFKRTKQRARFAKEKKCKHLKIKKQKSVYAFRKHEYNIALRRLYDLALEEEEQIKNFDQEWIKTIYMLIFLNFIKKFSKVIFF